ncbi:MAG: class I SAM-dependent methyltransferase [Pseudomonadota bacterium]
MSFGLQTVLGLRQKGFFIPMRTAPAAQAWAERAYGPLEALFAAAEPAFQRHLDAMDGYGDAFDSIVGPPPEPRFDQTWFPRLDAAALYTLIRERRPGRVVEVGSGHSTRFIMRAVRDGSLSTKVTAIDPKPRADIEGLELRLHRTTLQDAGTLPFDGLAPGDLLFVDSSHVLMPGTDVDIILNHVIPELPAGTLVGFHDIFLPDAYPAAWPFNVYNEQNAVAPLLRHAALLFASAYVVAKMPAALGGSWAGQQTLTPGARESILLLEL